ADRNRSHWSTSKTPSYTKSVSWQHHRACITTVIQPAGKAANRTSNKKPPDFGGFLFFKGK
ncbi:hypothetical protein, partial [Escherichia coli]|uniref:hypothetical protein n=1 Tax=Escherichia coli TaxID=562 RepID=UPI003CEFF9B5